MADYRQILFGPPELESYLADNTKANLNELNFFKNTVTPEIAQNAANISRAYPNMDAKLVMYGAMLGVQHDSDLALQLAERQNNVVIKQNQQAINKVSKGKRASQLGLLMLDLGFQPLSRNFKSSIVAADETGTNKFQAVAANTFIGGLTGAASFIPGVDGDKAADRVRRALVGDKFADVYKESKDAYGPTEFNLAYDEIKAGRPLNLGKGYFPSSTPIEETQGYKDLKRSGLADRDAYAEAEEIYGVPITERFEQKENQFKTETRKAGKVNISPGRVVAGQFFTKDDLGYAIGSAALDGAFRVFGDPTNAALGYLSGAKLGLRSLVDDGMQQAFKTIKVGDDIKNIPLINQFVKTIKGGTMQLSDGTSKVISPKEARKLMFGRTATQVLNTKRGDKLLDAFVANTDLATLMDMPGLNKAPVELLRLLTVIDDKNFMKTVLTSLMQNGNLAGVDDAMKLRYGVNDDVVRAISEGNQLKLPIQPNLLGEGSNLIAKKLLGKDTDVGGARKLMEQANKVAAVFNPTAADNLFTGIIGVGGDLRSSIPRRMSRYFDLAPGKQLSGKNIGESARNLDGIMKSARFTNDARNKYMEQILDTDNPQDMLETVKEVYKDIGEKIVERNPDLADFKDEIKESMEFLANESDLKRYMTTEESGKQLAYPGVKFKVRTKTKTKTGKDETVFEAVPTAQMISEYVDNYITLIDYAELERFFPLWRNVIGTKKSNLRNFIDEPTEKVTNRLIKRLGGRKLKTDPRTGRATPGGQTTLGAMYEDYLLQKVLKPVWMLRPALIARVIPEEMLRIIFSGSRVGLNHPLSYYAVKMTKGTTLEMQNAYGDVLWGTRIKKREMPMMEEILGPEFVKAAQMEYPQVERLLKHMKIGVNEYGMASDDYVSWVLNGNDGRDFIFRELNIEPVKSLKIYKGAIKEKANDGRSIGKVISDNPDGGSINLQTGEVNPAQFGAVSPYKNLGDSFNVEEMAVTLDKPIGTPVEELIEPLLINYLVEDAQAPLRQKYLRKENHVLGWWLDKTDNRVYIDVSVTIPPLKDTSTKSIEKALVGLATLGIKGKQLSAFIPDETRNAVWLKNFLDSTELSRWNKAIDTGDNLMWFVNKESPNKELLRDAATNDIVVRKQIMEALFDTNFDVAKVIKRTKRGVANVAPDGSWLPLQEDYLQAMSRKALSQFFEPVNNTALDGAFVSYDKIVNGAIDQDYIRNWIHQTILLAKNPITQRLLNDGIDSTIEWLLKSYDGKQVMTKLVKEADLRGRQAKEELANPVALRNNLEALGYRISRHIGGEYKIKDPLTGTMRTEDWATEIRFRDGVKVYPLYEYGVDSASSSALNFLKNGGFADGTDWLESWILATQGSGIKSIKGQTSKFYNDIWKIFKKDVNIFPDRINGAFNSLNNKFDADRLGAKYDDILEKLYNVFLTGPSDIANRDPLYRWSIYEHGMEAIPTMTEDLAMDFLKGAEQSLRGSKFGENILQEIVDKIVAQREVGFLDEIQDMDVLMNILGKKAGTTVIDLLYSTKSRHQFSDALSSYIPFPEIGAEVYKTWGTLMGQGPQKFNRSRIAFDAGDENKPWDAEMGFFFKDPVTGKRMFTYPDPFNVIQKNFFGEDLRQQGVRVRPAGFLSSLNLVTANGFLPGVGSREVWALEFLDNIGNGLPKVLEETILGDYRMNPSTSELVFEFIPSAIQKLMTAEYFTNNSDETQDARYASSVIDTLGVLYAKGIIDPTDSGLAAQNLENYRDAANNQWLIRGAVQATLPTGLQPRMEIKDKDGQWWFVQSLVKEYRRMLEINDYDYTTTQSEFVDRFGINPIPLIQTKRKPAVKTPYTESAVQFWSQAENRALMERKPRTAYYIRPDTIDDDWVWSGDFDAMRDYYTESEWDLLVRQTLLERELQNKKDELNEIADKDNTKGRKWVNGNYALFRRQKEDEYGIKGFASLGIGEIKADPSLDIMELETWKDEPQLSSSPEFKPLDLYLNKRKQIEDAMTFGGTVDGATWLPASPPTISPLTGQAERSAVARDILSEYGRELIEEYPDTFFNQIFYGILFYEVDNTRYED